MNSEQSLNEGRISSVRPGDIAVDGELEEDYSHQTDIEEEESDHSSVVFVDHGEDNNTDQATSNGVSVPETNVFFLIIFSVRLSIHYENSVLVL